MDHELLSHIRSLIGKGELQGAISELESVNLGGTELILKSRIENLNTKKNRGTVSFEDESIERNKILETLVELIDSTSNDKNDKIKVQKVDKELIKLVRKKLSESLLFYYLLALFLIIIGILLGAFFYFDGGIDAIKGIGSALISSSSGLPVREIINRRDRISFLEILLLKTDSEIQVHEAQRINKLSWLVIEEIILGKVKSNTN